MGYVTNMLKTKLVYYLYFLLLEQNFCIYRLNSLILYSVSTTNLQSKKIILFEILNLELKYRKKKKFQIVSAIFEGDNINQWLLLVKEQLIVLSQGIPTIDASTQETFNMKVRSLPGIFDLQAYYETYYQIRSGGILGCM